MALAVAPGLADPVLSAQRHFRALLGAMSRPGRIVRLDGELPPAPTPLAPAAYALALSLADHETPLWLDPALRRPEVEASLRFRCGCLLTTDPAAASLALAAEPVALPPLADFAQGTAEYPDRSTTIILQVRSFDARTALRLTGPGVDGSIEFAVDGLPDRFWAESRANHAQFPRGVDLIFVAGAEVVALPRSTRLAEAG